MAPWQELPFELSDVGQEGYKNICQTYLCQCMQVFIFGKQVVSSVTFSYLYNAAKKTVMEKRKGAGGILLQTNERVSVPLFFKDVRKHSSA